MPFLFVSVFAGSGEEAKPESEAKRCEVTVTLAIKSGAPDPFFILRDPAEIRSLAEAFRASFALPNLGPMEKVLHEANFQEIDELYGLYIDSSGCPGIPQNVRFWKGLIVVQRRGENEKLTDVSYLADTQRIESKLIALGWKTGAFSDWDIINVPPNLRPKEWRKPKGN